MRLFNGSYAKRSDEAKSLKEALSAYAKTCRAGYNLARHVADDLDRAVRLIEELEVLAGVSQESESSDDLD